MNIGSKKLLKIKFSKVAYIKSINNIKEFVSWLV